MYHHLQSSTHSLKEKENKGMLKAFKNSTNIRPTHLTERAKGSDQQVNLQEERKPHTILSTKKAKERSRRLCYLLPPKKVVDVSLLTIESNTPNDDKKQELREIVQKG